MVMDAHNFDHEVRAVVARTIRERGSIPSIAEVARRLRTDPSAVDASFARMIATRVFIPERTSHEIHAFNPFCVGPTDFAVRADRRDWWGICGWDALGIPAALGTTGSLTSSCGDGCGERIRIEVGLGGTASGEAVLQIGVPARSFWEDIYFT
jgi:hypothetical protein